MVSALVNGRVLSGDSIVEGKAVLLEEEHIGAVIANDEVPAKVESRIDLKGGLLLPGFLDIQVNGGGGVLFNDDPSVEAIHAIGQAHRRFGTCAFLPTLISDSFEVTGKAVAAVDAAIAARAPGVIGIHLEGPFLSPARKGIHDATKFRALDEAGFRLLTALKNGKTLVTLAPEITTPEMIARLSQAGIVLAAGHTNASYGTVKTALAHGLTGFTHLFNAMSPLASREPGTVGAALEDANSWCSMIVDGRHVAPAVLRLALRCKAADRFILVTDAMPSVGAKKTSFRLQGRSIKVEGDSCVSENGTLSGSNLGMAQAIRNAISLLGLDLATAVNMASRNPAEFLGLGNEFGKIAPGYRANIVLADDALNVRETWIDGRRSGERSD